MRLNQTSYSQNEHTNLVILPMLHVVQKEKHDNIPIAFINLDEDEKIFLKKGEILGYLEPSPIEITEIVLDEKEDESIPLEKKFITSPAEVLIEKCSFRMLK